MVHEDTNQPDKEFEAAFAEATGEAAEKPAEDDHGADDAAEAADTREQDDSAAVEAADAQDDDGDDADQSSSPNLGSVLTDLPEQARELVTNLVSEKTDLEHRIRSHQGRVSALNRRLSEMEATIAALSKRQAGDGDKAADDFADAATARQTNAEAQAILDDPAFKTLQEEYPEIAEPIATVLNGIQEKVQAIESAIQQRIQDEYLTIQEQMLDEQHPDWRDVVADQSFFDWLKQQPRFVREGIERNGNAIVDAAEAAAIIDLFKQARQVEQQINTPIATKAFAQDAKRRGQLRGAAGIAGKGPGKTSMPPNDYEAAFDYFLRADRRRA